MKIIKLTGEVGWEITPDLVQRILYGANGEDVRVDFSSPGGYVFDGFAIFNLFKNYTGNVHFHIIGEAASMGSYIVLSGDKITAEANAVFMIHNARSYVGGDHNEIRKRAEILEGLSNLIAKEYVKKTGKSMADVKTMMDSESWFFGSEIKDAGFVDEISGEEAIEAKGDRIAYAKESFLNCINKIKAASEAENIEQAAAFLPKIKVEKSEPEATAPEQPRIDAENTPKKEIINMSLEKIMAENPGVKAEVEALKTAAHNAGFTAGKESIEARIKKAAPVLGSATYPHALKALAVKVLNGESGPDALDGALAMVDMQLEQEKETAAKAEQKPDTPAATAPGITVTGAIDSEDAYQATIAQAKAGRV